MALCDHEINDHRSKLSEKLTTETKKGKIKKPTKNWDRNRKRRIRFAMLDDQKGKENHVPKDYFETCHVHSVGQIETNGNLYASWRILALLLPAHFISGCWHYGFIGVTTLWSPAVIVTRFPLPLVSRWRTRRNAKHLPTLRSSPTISTLSFSHFKLNRTTLQNPYELLYAMRALDVRWTSDEVSLLKEYRFVLSWLVLCDEWGEFEHRESWG